MTLPIHIADMDANAAERAVARKMVNEWLRPTEEQHAAQIERLASIACLVTLAAIQANEKHGIKFIYDA